MLWLCSKYVTLHSDFFSFSFLVHKSSILSHLQDITYVSPSDGEPGLSENLDEKSQVLVSGYAWAGGGRRIVRVDLTGDGGQTWTEAHSLK